MTCPENMLKRTNCNFHWAKKKNVYLKSMTMILFFSAAIIFSRRSCSFCVEANQMLLKTETESVEHTIGLGITLHGGKSLWAKPAATCLTIDINSIELLTKKKKKRIIWTAQQSVATFRLEYKDNYQKSFTFWAQAFQKFSPFKPKACVQNRKLVLVVVLTLQSEGC